MCIREEEEEEEVMTSFARSSAQRSVSARTRIAHAMVDELRMILDGSDAGQAQSLVAEFVVRHRLTHHDVDALMICLAQDDVTDIPLTFVAARTAADDPTTGDPIAAVLVPMEAAGTSAEPYRTAEKAETDALDDDLTWMFGEEPESPALRAADDIVGQALDDLLGDWARTGGQLTRAEVALLATKRKLSPAQHGALLDMLEAAGVDLPETAHFRPRRAASTGYELREDGSASTCALSAGIP
jgi:RNA polymerase primary sigma factor